MKESNGTTARAEAATTRPVSIDSISSKMGGISTFHCDILTNDDVEKLGQTVQDSFNGIDIVIDNGTKSIFSTISSDDCREFIDVTSGKLRTTINVRRALIFQIDFDFFFLIKILIYFQMLMHFIPKIKYSKCGHFVSIQPMLSNRKPLLSYGEIKTLINLLTDNSQSTFALDLFNRQQKIHLTTVLWNCYDQSNTNSIDGNFNGNNNNCYFEIKEVSERIIDGIKANRSVVNINKTYNLSNSIRTYFRKNNADKLNVTRKPHN